MSDIKLNTSSPPAEAGDGERLFEATFEQAAVGMAQVAPDGRWLRVNRKLCSIIGYSREELLELTFQDITHPDDLEQDLDQVDSMLRGEIDTYSMEKRYWHKDGGIVWINLTVSLICKADGSPDFFISVIEDISKRKAAEAALKHSEERFELAMLGTNDGLWDWDMRSNRVYYSPRYKAMLGYGISELANDFSTWEKLISDQDMARSWEMMQAYIEGRRDNFSIEFRMQHKDGHWVDILSRAFLVRDDDNQPVRVVGTHVDISDQKRVEAEVIAKEQRLSSIYHAAPIGIGYLVDRVFQEVNDTFCDLLGYSRGELIGQSTRLVYADDEEYERVGRIRSEQSSHTRSGRLETVLRRKDGTTFPAIVSSAMTDTDAQHSGTTFTVLNISELKDMQERLLRERDRAQHYLDIAGTILIALDSEGKITLINKKGCETLGLPEQQLLGQNWFTTFLMPEEREFVIDVFRQLMRGDGQPVEYVENTIVTHQGEQRNIAWHNSLTYDRSGNINGLLSSGEDVTERKRTGEKLRLQSLVLDQIQDHVTLTDLDGNILYVNEAEIRNTGHTKEALQNQHVSSYGDDPESDASQEQIVAHTLAEGSWRGEIYNLGRSGERKALDLRTTLIRDDAGIPKAMVGIATDITQKRLHEEQLRELEETYRQFFEVNSSIKLVIDPETGQILRANNAASLYYGYPIEVLKQMNISQINCLSSKEIRQEMQAAANQDRLYFNFKHRMASGEIRNVEVYSGPMQVKGRTLLFSIIHDVTEKMRQEQQLENQKNRLNAIIRGTHAGTWEWNVQTDQFRINRRWAEIIGYTPDELHPDPLTAWRTLTHPDDWANSRACLESHFSGENDQYECTIRMRHKQGHWVWLSERGRVSTWTVDAQPEWMYGTHLDITQAKQSESEILATNEKLQAILHSTTVAIAWANEQGELEYLNPRFTDLFGYVLADIPTVERWYELAYPEEAYRKQVTTEWNEKLDQSMRNGTPIESMEVKIQCKDKSRVIAWIHASWAGPLLVATFTDITETKKRQQYIEHLAHYDTLTGLPNRVLLTDRLQQYMSQTRRHNSKLAIAFLDLDGFKKINDSLTHDAGDFVLKQIALRLKDSVRESDTVARLGGDEFVIVFVDLETIEESVTLLERILTVVQLPVHYNRIQLSVSGSMGVTFYPQDESVEGDQLLRQADLAMYQAKLAGKNRYHVFDAVHDRSLRGHHKSLKSISQALSEEQFELHYQPIVNMKSGTLIGVEALIRWNHPSGDLVAPGEFIHRVETHPLAIELGEWVLERALGEMQSWQKQGHSLRVSINVFPYHLVTPDFATRLNASLSRHPDINPENLELEILETAALNDLEHVSKVIRACAEMGVRFSLDDFGTGYSSLTYLKFLPAETLKIDRSFIRDMLEDHDDLAIVEGTLGLAAAFRRSVIAEGVETREQGRLLLQLGCEQAQGYYIARPMPANELIDWIRTWKPDSEWMSESPLPYDRIPILYAATEHRNWIRQIELYIHDMTTTIPNLDVHECRFSNWLDRQIESSPEENARLRNISQLHNGIHETGAQLVRAKIDGELTDTESALNKLFAQRDEIIRNMDALLRGR